MEGFLGASKNPFHRNYNQLCLHQHHLQKQLEMEKRPGKRRRSTSPLNDKISRRKRASHHHHHPVHPAPVRARKDDDFPLLGSPHHLTSTINVMVEGRNKRPARLGQENTYPEDVEMNSSCGSDDEKDEDDRNSSERIPIPPSNSFSNALSLPLHKPHPIAYQQHLALISSTRSKAASDAGNPFNQTKKFGSDSHPKKGNKPPDS